MFFISDRLSIRNGKYCNMFFLESQIEITEIYNEFKSINNFKD